MYGVKNAQKLNSPTIDMGKYPEMKNEKMNMRESDVKREDEGSLGGRIK